MRIAVSGARGFVGAPLCDALSEEHNVVAVGREMALDDPGAWERRLQGVDVVIHLAGRAHEVHDRAADPLAEFRRVNVRGTLAVATAAADAGVRRFVFVSSIGVLGSESSTILTPQSPPAPTEPYAISKYEAEQGLHDLASRRGMELTIVRPPLVYGPNVKGNFLRLLQLIRTGLPLPVGSLHARRSFIGVRNLNAILKLCATHTAAAGRVFVVSDHQDISTAELTILLSRQFHGRNVVFRCPPFLLGAMMTGAGRAAEFRRLSQPLRVDPTAVKTVLNWSPDVDLETGMHEMVRWFRGYAT